MLILLDALLPDFVDVHAGIVLPQRVRPLACEVNGRSKIKVKGSRCAPAPIDYIGIMFVRRISIQRIDASGAAHPCPIRQIDNFAMRNFTNDPVFDDTLPTADGLLEAGHRVQLDRLQAAMEDWFRRKGYLKPEERLEVAEMGALGEMNSRRG